MPLNVIVVGAGLGGLGAAIALSRQGHNITITDDHRKNLNVYDEWVLTHRVDLHNALRSIAAKDIDGRKIDVRLSSPVISVVSRVRSIFSGTVTDQVGSKDAEKGEVMLGDGSKYVGDLVVGADGVHRQSHSVRAIMGENRAIINTGQSCFRFLIPVEKMRDNPLTQSLLERIGLNGVHVFTTLDRRLIVYPCRDKRLLNCAGIYPPSSAEEIGGDASWHNAGSVSQLVNTFRGFGEDLLEMCGMAEDVKLWSLASRDPAPTFVKGKLALIGDAAHPMLPHQGQGAAQAFEDAAALAGVLTTNITPEQLSHRLDMYNKIRYSHAVTVMMMSRTNDERRAEMLHELHRYVPSAELPKDMFAFAWISDPVREAAQLVASES
ncbi:hypothetical protein N7533_000345 [Penicillium manginii]|uniref:uncharacterized protein n=1 Tax=Penicillium manginii TaxID=203109 RepID=UPI0025466201|nr:uncharacterized protein N7533_000345 [Penicillium manginii]KAJ5767762.1 hypothetical protein N7533_000345 [Penicillium manginii]